MEQAWAGPARHDCLDDYYSFRSETKLSLAETEENCSLGKVSKKEAGVLIVLNIQEKSHPKMSKLISVIFNVM